MPSSSRTGVPEQPLGKLVDDDDVAFAIDDDDRIRCSFQEPFERHRTRKTEGSQVRAIVAHHLALRSPYARRTPQKKACLPGRSYQVARPVARNFRAGRSRGLFAAFLVKARKRSRQDSETIGTALVTRPRRSPSAGTSLCGSRATSSTSRVMKIGSPAAAGRKDVKREPGKTTRGLRPTSSARCLGIVEAPGVEPGSGSAPLKPLRACPAIWFSSPR